VVFALKAGIQQQDQGLRDRPHQQKSHYHFFAKALELAFSLMLM
jgi:urease beta subunit